MTRLIFRRACKNCNQGIDIDNSITDWENDLEYYKKLTDYEISKSLEKTMKNNGADCEFCDANNWDIWDLKVDDYQMYDLIKLNNKYAKKGSHLLLFHFPKRENLGHHTIYRTDPNPNSFIENIGFESRCKTEIKKIIESIPSSQCLNHSDGELYFCFSGNETEIKLEIFRHIGFTKEDLINITNQLTEI
ncbi:hypothetical protein SAMN05428642_1174 [Flaviramulus basaltis]|uniref:Uncharacterized protein n=1 Tax=Flaviramulus basaltis TaxID=369401 RepID=A0A1K2ISD3_9FLAO|nr:hypothetical protein [Flaviramulus basaltis]SFZ95222.1 hypothetical protein SAMN05428642_1174 [Flaviramulus basaltis]